MFAISISSLYSELADISGNIHFIEKELPSLAISRSEQLQIADLCAEFESALYDVRKEVRNLEDKLGMHPNEEPFDPDIKNPDPKVTMGFISDWLREPIGQMHENVLRLQRAAQSDAGFARAYVLVSESAVNVLNSYSAILDALGTIDATLEQRRV